MGRHPCFPPGSFGAMGGAVLNRFPLSTRLSVFAGLATVLTFTLGFARPVSAQRQPAEEDLKPIPSGPGIQICEPVAPEGSAALADFGSGCGLWLQWSMGFHPELGQTPRWETAIRAQKELHVPRLQLTLAQGSRLVPILGVTHIAVGKITGAPAKCVLTYQLYSLPAQKAIGLPIKLVGSETQVIAQLPQAARTLLTGLGVAKPHVPASVGATPAELTEIGHYNWYGEAWKTEADQPQIDALSRKLPLASLLSFAHHHGGTNREKEAAARHILQQAAGNFLMLGILAPTTENVPQEYARLIDSRMTVPGGANNSVLAYWGFARAHSAEDDLKAAQRVVRLAPRSALAWYCLASKYKTAALTIRGTRVFAALSALEREKLQGLYFREMVAAVHATSLDADYADAWHSLAGAALFADDRERADTAFWRAVELDKNSALYYSWGLEMYQPKWGGDPETLAKVARLAMEATYPPDADLYSLAYELNAAKFPEEAKTMYGRAITQLREAARLQPKDAHAHLMLGFALKDQRQLQEAESELKTAAQLDPDNSTIYYQLHQLYINLGRLPEAVAQLREYVRLTNDPFRKRDLASMLFITLHTTQLDEPEKLLREVLKAQPNWPLPHQDLGKLLTQKKMYDAALAEYVIAARLEPNGSVPHREMSIIYRLQGRSDDAIREGEIASALEPNNTLTMRALADAYADKGDYDSSLKTYKQLLTFVGNVGESHIGLGKVYLKMGKKEEARAELKKALTLYLSPEDKQTAQELLDKNP